MLWDFDETLAEASGSLVGLLARDHRRGILTVPPTSGRCGKR